MARKKGGGGGGHGGGWFVTFADLMALLMSFFVMLTAMSQQDTKKMQQVAGAMRDAFGASKNSRTAGIVELDGIPYRPTLKNIDQVTPQDASDITAPTKLSQKLEGLQIAYQDRKFALAAASLRQALQEMPEISELSKNIIVQETKEGLDIEIVDQDGRSMFAEGAKVPYERTRALIAKLGPVIRRMPNRVRVTGHTSAVRGGSARPNSGSWDLSTQRALAVREILSDNGVPDERFYSVGGRADTEPLFPDDPTIAANRRISILLMNEAPPVPPGSRP
jgi:chemotaxis protein MotB